MSGEHRLHAAVQSCDLPQPFSFEPSPALRVQQRREKSENITAHFPDNQRGFQKKIEMLR